MRRTAAPLVLSILLLLPVLPVSASEPSLAPIVSPGATPVNLQPAPVAGAPSPVVAAPVPVPVPAAAAPVDPPVDPPVNPPLDAQGRFIVILDAGVNARQVRDRHASRSGVRADRLFQKAVRGFAGRLTAAQVKKLRADPDVAMVVPDEIIEVAAQTMPTGVSRIGANTATSSVARIDGVDERVDADVAIVDTGIDPTHPDLNVVGGVNCTTSDRSQWQDEAGHGTHVAGTVAAIDNGGGVVGVAPGARLWAVRILDSEGFGFLSWYVCGLDWIAAQRDPADPSLPLIESVNMSVTKWGKDDGNCGYTNADILHQAICRVTGAGVTVVAAAANDAANANLRVPASYDEVITVSALADTDGRAGGLGGNRCLSWGTYDVDDTFADFSNYGADVDIIAPGKCIWSTLPANRYGYSSGTSMAAPAVTGAVALYKASRPWATPTDVKLALQLLGSTNWVTGSDPDATHERLVSVNQLGPAGDFPVVLGTPVVVGEKGGTVTVPITIARTPTHFETLRLAGSVAAPLAGTLNVATLSGFTATQATFTVTVPPATLAGHYPVVITAVEGLRSQEATINIQVESDLPTALPPSAVPISKEMLGTSDGPVRVAWPAATDPSSPIGGYELQHAVDGGEWEASVAFAPTTLATAARIALGHVHQFRLRARDTANNWSDWAAGASFTFGVLDDRHRSLRWSTGWSKLASIWSYAGTFTRTLRSNTFVRATISGQTLALVAPVGPRLGWVRVYVGGVLQAKVSLYAAVASSRRILWVKTFADGGPKAVELRADRTYSRSRVEIDAILAIQ